jgi:hypothetical protein
MGYLGFGVCLFRPFWPLGALYRMRGLLQHSPRGFTWVITKSAGLTMMCSKIQVLSPLLCNSVIERAVKSPQSSLCGHRFSLVTFVSSVPSVPFVLVS